MTSSFVPFNPSRIRSFVFRLPLCTRVLLFVAACLWAASIPLPWLQDWAALIPSKIDLTTMYRLNTYPLMHLGFFHLLLNVLALAPLLERFESEFGTLITFSLFSGPFGLLPGGLYILMERFILRSDVAVSGASIWVFLLLSAEAMKAHKTNPLFRLGPYNVPTWVTPLFPLLAFSFLVPNVSFVGHVAGSIIGYLWGLGYIRFLVPPEKILRFVEGKLNLLGRLPHYVSVDQKTYGRYGVLPTSAPSRAVGGSIPIGSPGQRLGP